MPKDVNKLLKGASDVVLAAVDDAGAASPAQCGDTFPLLSLGFLDENSVQSETKKLTQKDGSGSLLQLGEIASVNINSLSASQQSINAKKKFKNAQVNIYGFGVQQSHKLLKFLMNVETPHDLKSGGKSVVQFSTEKKISPDEALGTIGAAPAAFAADVAYKYQQYINNIRQEDLVFAFLPYLGNFGQTGKVYEASDNRLSVFYFADVPKWNNAPLAGYYSIGFNGVNDYINFGNILSPNAVDDFLVEAWVKVFAADGGGVYLFGNKTSYGNPTPGWLFYRTNGNAFGFNLGDGTNQYAPTGGSVLQNVWKHLAVAIDRDGNGILYIDGQQVQSSSVASIGNSSTTNNFYIGRSVSGVYGNLDIGAIRYYNFGAGKLPSNIGTIVASHFNAEKAIFGL
ncbi:MAG: LamG domain-containing protein [Bacteroidota bacterium]